MNLSTILFHAAHNAGTASNAGFLQECGQQARQLENAALDIDVRAAHTRFGTAAPGFPVKVVEADLVDTRMAMIEEEVDELLSALAERNLAKIAHEAIDLIYVVVGTLVCLGLPLLPFWRAVHKANMAKVPAPGGGKWLKPEGWQPADARQVLYDIRRAGEGVE